MVDAAGEGEDATHPWEDAAVENIGKNDGVAFCQTVDDTELEKMKWLGSSCDEKSDDDGERLISTSYAERPHDILSEGSVRLDSL